MLEALLLLRALVICQRLINRWLPPALIRIRLLAPLLAAAVTPVRSARPVPFARAESRPVQIICAGEGWPLTAGRRSRAWPRCARHLRPVGAQGEIPRRLAVGGSTPVGHPGSESPAGERSHSPAQTRGSQRRRASARSWRRCARSLVQRGGPNPCAAAALGEMPRQYAQGATFWPRAASVLHASLGSWAAQPGRGQVGGRGAPAAVPQLESSQFRRAAAQTPQPRLHSDFTGESDGAAPMPHVRRTHLSQASLFSGSGRRPRLTPSHSSDQLGTSCCRSKPLGAPPGRGGGEKPPRCAH
ncbi:hypothetical protein NDU88_004649 [Pleurodeles waltl]|uniref:Uncharacterized protein n=1 Tax=Pleurodeles waltl TaxID=8319 RepID=A0AAV7T876_PLEWA|nr:hypothetical protein NDU88_004649 [Pleurodeles waltl]